MFDEEFIKEAEGYSNLGPAYFDSRAVVRKFMDGFDVDQLKPLVDKITDDLRDKLWSDFESYLFSDTESNLQGHLWRMVDNTVQALLSGQQWALDKYVTNDSFDSEKIRKSLVSLIPEELQKARIVDLEKQVDRLEKDLRMIRERY